MRMKEQPTLVGPYLTVGQAAEELAVHPSTIRRWIDAGRLPAFRLGEKRIGVRRFDLARLVAPRPPRIGQGARRSEVDRAVVSPPTEAERRRGLRALATLGRLGRVIENRHGGLIPASWELLNQSHDERSRDLEIASEA